MSDEIRSLSDTEIDVVAGGLPQGNDPQSLVVMPDPGFVIGTNAPAPGSSSWSWGANQSGGY